MRSVAVLAILTALLAVSANASSMKKDGEKKAKSSSAGITTGAKKAWKSSSSKKALKATGVAKLKTVQTSKNKKQKYVFDPMHLHFGNDPQMKKLKHSLYMSEGSLTEQLVGPATTDMGKKAAAAAKLDATKPSDSTDSATDAPSSSLRSVSTDAATDEEKIERRRLSASLWESMFGGMFGAEKTTELEEEEGEDNSEAIQGKSNSSVPDVSTVVPNPPAKQRIPAETDEKPKKRALKYFESKFYGGDEKKEAACRIEHNTFFTSHTFGVEACFPSSLSTDSFPVYTASFYNEVLDEEEDMQHSYSVTTRFYYDKACQNEWDHQGYFPIQDVSSSSCEEKENLEVDGPFDVVSKQSVLWELSHAPHRETAGHQMSISLYAKGHDCRAGQADRADEYLTLQERLTFSHASDTCMENDDGQSYFMKCLPDGEVTIHAFDNPDCSGKEAGTALLTREDLCKAEWSGIYTTGRPVVQCGIGENWADPTFSKGKDFEASHIRIKNPTKEDKDEGKDKDGDKDEGEDEGEGEDEKK